MTKRKPREDRGTCRHCGERFESLNGNALYCSDQCQNRAHYARRGGATQRRAAKFNLTVDELKELLAKNPVCELCGSPPRGLSRWERLHIDHCHATGVVRGVLCGACNVALGHMKDDPALLRRAADYLEARAG